MIEGVFGRSIFPPLLCKKVVVPTASVLSLFTTPFTLIPGATGKVLVPDQCFVTKQSGAAYTINGATLNFSWAGVTVWAAYNAAALIGFLDVTIPASIISLSPGMVGISGNTVPAPTIVGQSLTLHNSVANFTLGTGDLIFWLTFRVFEFSNPGWF